MSLWQGKKYGFRLCRNSLVTPGPKAPEGIFLSAQKKIQRMEYLTSGAKAGYGSVIYGTAEPVPFQDRVLTHAL
jgi:hypothetical protein